MHPRVSFLVADGIDKDSDWLYKAVSIPWMPPYDMAIEVELPWRGRIGISPQTPTGGSGRVYTSTKL